MRFAPPSARCGAGLAITLCVTMSAARAQEVLPGADALQPILSHLWIGGGTCDAPLNPVDWVVNVDGRLYERDLALYVAGDSASMEGNLFTFTGALADRTITRTYKLQADATLRLWTERSTKLDGSDPRETIRDGHLLYDQYSRAVERGADTEAMMPCPQRIQRFDKDVTEALDGDWTDSAGGACTPGGNRIALDLKNPVPTLVRGPRKDKGPEEGFITSVDREGAGWMLTLGTLYGGMTDRSFTFVPAGAGRLTMRDPDDAETLLKRCPS